MVLSLKKLPWPRPVLIAAIAFFLITLVLLLNRYYTFYATYDQGIFNQVFWNGSHGRMFQSSLSSQLSTNVVHAGEVPEVYYHRLGQHFTPSLLLWLPLYSLFPSPVTLSVLQVILATAAGLVLYPLARHYLAPPLATFITVSYFAANGLIGPILGNFHDITQIPLFVFGLFLALEKRWWWVFGGLATLIPLVREDSGLVLFGIGLYLILSKRYPRIGFILCIYSFLYIVLLTNVVMPRFSEDISKRFMMEMFGQYVEGDEATTLEIIGAMLRNPLQVILEIFSPFGLTVKYLLGHWLPLAFIPVVSPTAWLLTAFPLLKLFSAQAWQATLSINMRYAMSVVPGLFYGTILWWSQHPQLFKKLRFRRFWIACLCLSIFFTITSSPHRTLYFVIPESIQPWVYVSLTRQWQHASEVRALLAQIPENASVSATTPLVPHLSSRRAITRFPYSLEFRGDDREVRSVEYAIADLWHFQQYQPAFDEERHLIFASIDWIDDMLRDQSYGVLDFRDGVILLQQGIASHPEALQHWTEYREELLTIPRSG